MHNSLIPSILIAVHLAIMVGVCIYGVHRWFLVILYYRHRPEAPILKACWLDLPPVTVQLPMYNEPAVAERVVRAAARLRYPRDRLQIQVLDDSTDQTVETVARVVAELRAEGLDIVHRNRTNRTGYKAGALAEALPEATGEFVLILDADFIPHPDLIYRCIHHFTDPRVAMVQSRWEHLNRDNSLLTQAQAILLDGHFMIEHIARNRSGRFINFNGTAGMWRKQAIEDAGNWQHDTITEDLDLSYRAQMKGWQFVFLPNSTTPGELPPDMNAFKAQQHRWTKGGVQTCRKVLPRVLKSRLPIKIKAEAFMHLTCPLVWILILVMSTTLLPIVFLRLTLIQNDVIAGLFGLSLFVLATCSASTFYMASQRELFHTWAEKLKFLPFLIALGVGISINNGLAAIEGLFCEAGEFVRTPKFGACRDERGLAQVRALARRQRQRLIPYLELLYGLALLAGLLRNLALGSLGGDHVFVILFTGGFFYVSLTSLFPNLMVFRRRAELPTATPA
jgi:cellulose synthase/poly-beta-1,6-N-acetylglucosamine synthase-like glycosyltransferase